MTYRASQQTSVAAVRIGGTSALDAIRRREKARRGVHAKSASNKMRFDLVDHPRNNGREVGGIQAGL